MSFDLQKYAAPLSITATVLGIWLYIRGENSSSTTVTQGNLPSSATVPSFENVPAISYNVATPSSNAGNSSQLSVVSSPGISIAGTTTALTPQASSTQNQSSGYPCNCSSSNTPNGTYANTTQQSAVL